jgi:hypothetical protein
MDELLEPPWCAHTRRDKHRSMLKDPLLVRKAGKRVSDKIMRKRRTHKRLQSVAEVEPWAPPCAPASPASPAHDWVVVAPLAVPRSFWRRLLDTLWLGSSD